jgi:hypothetical protein
MTRESWTDTDDKTIRDDIVSIAKEKTGLAIAKAPAFRAAFLKYWPPWFSLYTNGDKPGLYECDIGRRDRHIPVVPGPSVRL